MWIQHNFGWWSSGCTTLRPSCRCLWVSLQCGCRLQHCYPNLPGTTMKDPCPWDWGSWLVIRGSTVWFMFVRPQSTCEGVQKAADNTASIHCHRHCYGNHNLLLHLILIILIIIIIIIITIIFIILIIIITLFSIFGLEGTVMFVLCLPFGPHCCHIVSKTWREQETSNCHLRESEEDVYEYAICLTRLTTLEWSTSYCTHHYGVYLIDGIEFCYWWHWVLLCF